MGQVRIKSRVPGFRSIGNTIATAITLGYKGRIMDKPDYTNNTSTDKTQENRIKWQEYEKARAEIILKNPGFDPTKT